MDNDVLKIDSLEFPGKQRYFHEKVTQNSILGLELFVTDYFIMAIPLKLLSKPGPI